MSASQAQKGELSVRIALTQGVAKGQYTASAQLRYHDTTLARDSHRLPRTGRHSKKKTRQILFCPQTDRNVLAFYTMAHCHHPACGTLRPYT
jgi:hypothetical protein